MVQNILIISCIVIHSTKNKSKNQMLGNQRPVDEYFQLIDHYNKSGWNNEHIDNVKCVKCHNVLRDAIQTMCGCRYCRECLTSLISNRNNVTVTCRGPSDECQLTTLSLNEVINDTAINKDILSLKVKCPNKPCKFETKLRSMTDHLSECDYRFVVCERCNLKIRFIETKDHLINHCVERDIICRNCNKSMSQKLYDKHLDYNVLANLCDKFIDTCPYCQTANVVLKSHSNTCEIWPKFCLFKKDFQCNFRGTKQQLMDHLITEGESHMDCIMSKLNKVEELEANTKTLDTKLELQNANILQLKNELDRLEKTVAKLNLNSSRPQVISQPLFNNGNFVWKITDFSKLQMNAEMGTQLSKISDSFYSSEFGYRLCLKVYPFGDGVGRGHYLSVYFVIMRGDYDDMISWPFRNKIVLSLINPNSSGGRNQIAKSDTFRPDVNSICYEQPKEEFNIASGSPKFISLTELTKYLRNDNLFLKIEVLNS